MLYLDALAPSSSSPGRVLRPTPRCSPPTPTRERPTPCAQPAPSSGRWTQRRQPAAKLPAVLPGYLGTHTQHWIAGIPERPALHSRLPAGVSRSFTSTHILISTLSLPANSPSDRISAPRISPRATSLPSRAATVTLFITTAYTSLVPCFANCQDQQDWAYRVESVLTPE